MYDLSTSKYYFVESGYYQKFLNLENEVSYEDFSKECLVVNSSYTMTEICEFVETFKFVTMEQMERYIKVIGLNPSNLNVSQLCKYDVLMETVLVKDSEESCIVRKSNIIYCIGKNGIKLLKNHGNYEGEKWSFANISKSADKVLRHVLCVDAYLNLIESFGYSNIIKARANPFPRFVGNAKMNIDMEFFIDLKDTLGSNIIQVVRENDFYENLDIKLNKLERFVCTNAWHSMGNEECERPNIIFICQDESMMAKLSKKIAQSSLVLISKAFVTCDSKIKARSVLDGIIYKCKDNGEYELDSFNFASNDKKGVSEYVM